MTILKRATRKLQEAGFVSLEVHRCAYGYSVRDRRYVRQTGRVYQTAAEAVASVIEDGQLPVQRSRHPVTAGVSEERCQLCNHMAAHKIGEVENEIIPFHPMTNYLCCYHFRLIVGDCRRYPYETPAP